MQWVPAENCSLSCPINTVCMRPLEFLEPIYCIHEKFSMPNDLIRDPICAFSLYNSAWQHWPLVAVASGLIITMILLQVSLNFCCLQFVLSFKLDFLISQVLKLVVVLLLVCRSNERRSKNEEKKRIKDEIGGEPRIAAIFRKNPFVDIDLHREQGPSQG